MGSRSTALLLAFAYNISGEMFSAPGALPFFKWKIAGFMSARVGLFFIFLQMLFKLHFRLLRFNKSFSVSFIPFYRTSRNLKLV